MAFSDPQKILQQFGISSGATIADFGAGSGAYSLAAAKMVGNGGKIFAIDVQADLLSKLKNQAQAEHITNIDVIHGDIEVEKGSNLKEQTVDGALICNVFFQIEQKAIFADEVRRILKSTGRVLLVDWTDSFGGIGSHQDQVVSKEIALSLFEKHGFIFVSELRAGDHHYGLIFRKN